MIDHDRLFKELISTFLPDFITLFLPDITAYLEAGSLVFLEKEIFTDVTSGEKYEADLVARAKFRNRRSHFILHIEHQSKSQADFDERMFRYFALLHFKHAMPVYPVAIYSHDTPRGAEPDSYQIEFPGFVANQFNYRVIQLNQLRWQDYRDRQNPVACALMCKMQVAPGERPAVKLECLRMLYHLELNPAQVKLISGFIDTYLKLSPEEDSRFQAELARILPEEQEGIMEIVTSWMEKGIEQGRQEGILLGVRQEAQTLVLRQLSRRVGALSPELEERIRRLSVSQLEILGEALLDFSNMADLEAWLGNLPSQS